MLESIFLGFQNTAVFIIALSILILVHEWGHFITAKKLGVNVEEFSLGFGPTLFSKFYNGTNYLIKLLPLGGYVKMAGDERDKCKGTPQEFFSKPVGHRALIVLNGPVINVVLAYFCFVIVFVLGYPGLSTQIKEIVKDGPAYQTELQVGDEIVAINDHPVYGVRNFKQRLNEYGDGNTRITVKRNDQRITVDVKPDVIDEQNDLGLLKSMNDLGINFHDSTVGFVAGDKPAGLAGINEGDKILYIDDVAVNTWTDVQNLIATSKGESIEIKILRDEQNIVFQVVPQISKRFNEDGVESEHRIVGIGPSQQMTTYKFSFFNAIRFAFDEMVSITVMTYKAIYFMCTGAVSAKESVGGPVMIFGIFAAAAQSGISHYLFVLGVISLSLAIFNLLPVIPLDGGHIFLVAIEKIRGRALPPKIDEIIAKVGFSLIIMLALYIFYIDFDRIGFFDLVGKLFRK